MIMTKIKGLATPPKMARWTAPIISFISTPGCLFPYARIAQLVEQRIENPRVGGSNPPPGTIIKTLVGLMVTHSVP